ncbi:winged helix-turn-helix transcriptional regulator [Nucisporomicrobium flavum]|uniref:winged helix-turn-helix transcriptional regulator n=1 Tax=Nucisporomicrobium flavum TaxID=2785915 RepID=UPI003C2C5956
MWTFLLLGCREGCLLLLREAFLGRTKYAEFLRIGVPTATLGARLQDLVDAGLLTRHAYQEKGERARDEYLLTQAGRDAMPILAALIGWGETHLPPVTAYAMTTGDGRPVRLAFVDDTGTVVDADAVAIAKKPEGAATPG